MKIKSNSLVKKIIIGIIIFIVILIGVFAIWALVPQQPMEAVDSMLLSDENVLVLDSKYLSFLPSGQLNSENEQASGLIIYPGARVSATSYAYIGRELALQGISVYILKPPLRMAIFSVSLAQQVIDDNPQIDQWYVGGHSLGGATASIFAYEHQDELQGIIYLAAYPVNDKDFSTSELRALTLYGSEDAFATEEDIDSYDVLQPSQYTKYLIEGGNHEQFGYYGHQNGDNPALISREDQQRIIVEEILKFILNQ